MSSGARPGMGMVPSSNLSRNGQAGGMPLGSPAQMIGSMLARKGGAATGPPPSGSASSTSRLVAPGSSSSTSRPPASPTPIRPLTPMSNRLYSMYNQVSMARIQQIITQVGWENPGRVAEVVRNEHLKALREGSSHDLGSSGVGLPKATKAPVGGHANQGYSTAAQMAAQLSSSAASTPSRTAIPSPISTPISKPAPKPRKNENSRIYANRGGKKKSRKRDPDESDTAEEESAEEVDDEDEEMDMGSDSDSDAGWSGAGRKKKKRRTYEDPDAESEEDEESAEAVALKAFNEDTAEMITGTICTFLQCLASVA